MAFMLQLIGSSAGGEAELGEFAALQVFCCFDPGCDAFEPLSGRNAAYLRRALTRAVVEPPGGAVLTRSRMDFKKGFDDIAALSPTLVAAVAFPKEQTHSRWTLFVSAGPHDGTVH
jgi:hypothetical protein